MNNASRLLAPLALLLGSAADGQQLQTTPISASVDQGTAPQPDATTISLGLLDQRLTVPVVLGAAGPYPFIIDTGAERTVVSRELAHVLGLVAGPTVNLTSMTGRSKVSTVVVPDLTIPAVGKSQRIEAPALASENLGAAGLLGLDTLSGHEVMIDFEANQMAVRPASKRRANDASRDPDEIVVQARSKFGQLIVTEAFVGNSRIRVVIDTGSEVSMGNSALRKRVRIKQGSIQPVMLTSVTGGKTVADYTLVPAVRIGAVQFDAVPIAFADVAPFERFGLTKQPALLLGMDALRSFRRVEIDFPNRQVRFLMPKGAHRNAF